MAKVLKICCGEWKHETRDRRELSLYNELGMETMVFSKGEHNIIETIDGQQVLQQTTRPLGEKVPSALNKICSIFAWAKAVRRLDFDVLTCHDIGALTIGWLSTIALPARRKPKLIYDSHEFEIGRNTKRSKLQTFLIKYWERFLIKRSAFTIVVCDSIADELQKIHKLANRPIVIRSVPELWHIDSDACKEKRQELLGYFDDKITHVVLYHGNIRNGVGIEKIFEALNERDTLALVLMGSVSEPEKSRLYGLSEELGIKARIKFLPPVKQQEIWKYSGAADFEIMLIEAVVKSYYYALPNKFFEAVQSETPMIASNLPEMKSLIDKYDIGLTIDPNNMEGILKCIDEMCFDKEMYERFKRNLIIAKRELCWEKEKLILAKAFKKYIG